MKEDSVAKKLKDNLPGSVSDEDRKYVEKYGNKLSDSTQYAQWISNTDEHEDHHGASLITRNHEVIKGWAEERDAKPATVPGTEHGDRLGVLRFNFPGYGGDSLEEVSWEDWFKTFDERDLVFLYQEHLKSGDQSNFFRLESPHREDG
jgi:hypothetical protein